MTEQDLRDRLIRLEAQSEERLEQMRSISRNVEELVADLHQRRGQSDVTATVHRESREDRVQRDTWLRAFLPTGIMTGLWLGVLELLRRLGDYLAANGSASQ